MSGLEGPDGLGGRWPEWVSPETVRARRRAQDPATPPPELRGLVLTADDAAVRRAALANPVCPDAVRAHAAVHDPDPDVRAAAVHRVGDLVGRMRTLLRDPAWQVRAAVAARRDLPADVLLDLALHDPDGVVRRTAIANRALPSDHVRRILATDRLVDAEIAVAHPNLDLGCDPAEFVALPRSGVRQLLVERPDAPGPLLAHVAYHDGSAVVRRVAVEHPGFPADRLPGLLADRDPEVRVAAVRHPSFPSSALPAALGDRSAAVRLSALARPDIDPGVIGPVATGDPEPRVRAAACRHPACPRSALDLAVGDGSTDVRVAVAEGAGCSPEALLRACGDRSPKVRLAAVQNTRVTPGGAVAVLVAAQDRSSVPPARGPGSRSRRRERVEESVRLARELLCGRPWQELRRLPLERLAEGNLWVVLADRLRSAARHRSPVVRAAVASHPQVPVDLLEALSRDRDPAVRAAASDRLLSAVI